MRWNPEVNELKNTFRGSHVGGKMQKNEYQRLQIKSILGP